MFTLPSRSWSAVVAAALAFAPSVAPAQDQPPGVEVLARGPVHEAYASSAEFPLPGPVVPKLPPDPVDELPPDQKPAGENVQWVPGYWQWDEERSDFVWVSGFWRVPPPGRVWVPGTWREVRGGWQWTAGFWHDPRPAPQAAPAVAQAEIDYLPSPPPSLDAGPSVPAPTPTCFYVPGSWVWRGRYVWRPGTWVEYRPDWVWVPARYVWTPGGYVFVDGYWDYPLATRGVLFAPVAFAPAVVARPAFVYTPAYVVPPPAMVTAMFVRRGYSSYYFGDYFEPRYTTLGFSAWFGGGGGGGFAVNVNVNRGGYNPMWDQYRLAHRADPRQLDRMQELYAARYRGDAPRPPRTVVHNVQNNVVVNNVTNNVTNVQNNVTVNNVTVNPAAPVVAPLRSAPQVSNMTFKDVPREERDRDRQFAREVRDVGVERKRAETQLADRGLAPTLRDAPAPVQQVKLAMPANVVQRASRPGVSVPPPATSVERTSQELRGPQRPPQPEPARSLPGTVIGPGVSTPLPTPAPVRRSEPDRPNVSVPLPTPKPAPPAPAPPQRVPPPQNRPAQGTVVAPQPQPQPRPQPQPVAQPQPPRNAPAQGTVIAPPAQPLPAPKPQPQPGKPNRPGQGQASPAPAPSPPPAAAAPQGGKKNQVESGRRRPGT